MIRIVLDTNIIVSALLYEEVICRPRFRLEATVISQALHTIPDKSHWVRPTEAIHACSDPDDNIFLECAQAGHAAYLVTGNTKHFPASWLNINVVTPRRFLGNHS